ncbi:uncharacterized protein LOC116122896 [Pistacia vera]|uniref:uncharacterized protein LOC116107917 n=1 Tax=Pistacia vera TaxID=55513 RepID=UPI0012632336|nr:uncharacterized protein LOC116107917 [Pistacia vera]XP_031264559.1 uncharacterized protein LOC116122896 [Pistacia vera]
MEAAKEDSRLLNKIIPPRLEDAGLEDCALPPDAIKEAFFKAASVVKSRATSFFHSDDEEEDCLDDPWPQTKDVSDTVVGVSSLPEATGPCGVVKGGGVVEEGEDKVVVTGGGGGDDVAEEKYDVVVGGAGDVAEGKGGSGCVEGLKGLKIEDKEKKENKESERPTLVKGFV